MPRTSMALLTLLASSTVLAGEYRVSADADLLGLQVQACFPGDKPAILNNESQHAARLIRDVRTSAGTPVARTGGTINMPADTNCVEYRIDLSLASQQGHWRRPFVRHLNSILISPELFLWFPEPAQPSTVRFELPAGMNVSTPWRATRRNETVYRLGDRPRSWDAKIAIGRLEHIPLKVGGATLDIALLEGKPAVDSDKITTWLRRNAEAVAAVTGRFPIRRTQVLVTPIGQGDEPVPWGQISRGGGESVHLYIDQRANLASFLSDWVLSHELAHLFHPFIESNGRWLYEGLASYYQNVARARAGLMSEKAAWEELHAGFNRGRFQTRRNQSLRDASANMMRSRAFMRVYWSGAAIFMLADLELRQRSEGRQSLDSTLRGFERCCLPSRHIWSAREVMNKLDEISDTSVFSEMYDTHVLSDRFPDTRAAFNALGLNPVGRNELQLSRDREETLLRRAIMGPRS